MKNFNDYLNTPVRFSSLYQPFSSEPKHVWIIPMYKGQWLLTNHKRRGLEFPGGKVEPGESIEDAALRELYEETGGVAEKLIYIGQYEVLGEKAFVKNVYYAPIEELTNLDHYHETNGPILLPMIPSLEEIRVNEAFSFIMKDEVLQICLDEIRKVCL